MPAKILGGRSNSFGKLGINLLPEILALKRA
jgi:hypothetical protein